MMSREPNIEVVRRAIEKHRGGHEATSDAGIVRLWRGLDEPTRTRYLAAVRTRGGAASQRAREDGNDADDDGSQCEV